MQYFYLKMYWRKDYFWQESKREDRYCAKARGSGKAGEKLEIQKCSTSDKKQQWRFYGEDRDNRFMLESYYRAGLCIGLQKKGLKGTSLDGTYLMLQQCDQDDKDQRWNWVGKSDQKFEWQLLREEERCVSNEHHPSAGEGLKVMKCKTAKREETNYWTLYD